MTQDPFERLAPPPGGLAGLRRKLDACEARQSRSTASQSQAYVQANARPGRQLLRSNFTLLPLMTVLAIGVALLGPRFLAPQAERQQLDYGIFQSWMESPASRQEITLIPADSQNVELVPLPSPNAGVSLYWLAEMEETGE